MEHFKFGCYVGLMTFCYAAVGLFLAAVCFMFLGHTTVAVLHDTLRLTPTHFLVLGGIVGAGLGLWMGWSEGSKRYLANGAKQIR
jgi:hypothetical protein